MKTWRLFDPLAYQQLEINVSRHLDQDGTPVPGITTDNFQLNTRIDVPSLLRTVSVSKSVVSQ